MASGGAIQAWSQRSVPRVPFAFQEGTGTVPNNPMVAAVLAAVLKGGPNARHLLNGWAPADDGRLVYRHIGKRGGEILVYFDTHDDGVATGRESLDPAARQIALIEALNPLTADVMFMVLAQTCEPGLGNRAKYPLLDPVPISANTMMKTKGFKSWGKERDKFRDRIGAEVDLLSHIRCDVIRFPGWDPAINRWNPKGVSALGERLFETLLFDDGGVASSANPRQDRIWLTRLGAVEPVVAEFPCQSVDLSGAAGFDRVRSSKQPGGRCHGQENRSEHGHVVGRIQVPAPDGTSH